MGVFIRKTRVSTTTEHNSVVQNSTKKSQIL